MELDLTLRKRRKLHVRYIQALEEEDYEILPGTTYVKGYLRTYAKQLGFKP